MTSKLRKELTREFGDPVLRTYRGIVYHLFSRVEDSTYGSERVLVVYNPMQDNIIGVETECATTEQMFQWIIAAPDSYGVFEHRSPIA